MAKKFEFGTESEIGDTGSGKFDFTGIASDPLTIGDNGGNNGEPDTGGADGGSDKPRRGRKPRDPNAPKSERKPRGKPSNAQIQNGIDTLKNILAVVHVGIGTKFNSPEIAGISDAENEMVAKAAVNVLAEFDITPDPKVAAVLGFVMVAGSVYGPRVIQIQQRNKREKKTTKNKLGLFDPSANVVNLNESAG